MPRLYPITLSMAVLGLIISLPAYAALDIVISQIYGGGGNSGAPYTHDFIELFNRGPAPLALTGWSLQYASATSTGNFGASASQVTELPAIMLQPGQYLLVQEATQSATGSALPTPDVTDATPIAMAATGGKVALVNTTTALGCNGGSTPCLASALATIVDLAGYGSANFHEGGGAAPAPSNTTAVFRASNGCQDSGSNNADFTTAAPAPRNHASTLNTCGGAPLSQPIVTHCPVLSLRQGTAGSVTLSASDADSKINGASITSSAVAGISLGTVNAAFADGERVSVALNVASTVAAGNYPLQVTFTNNEVQSASCTVNVSVAGLMIPIYLIQGSGVSSSAAGTTVTTQGVVTKLNTNGYFLQDEAGDNDSATSDGIFVFTSSAPTVTVGDRVRLTAKVTEFKTGSGATAQANPVTELTSPANIAILASGIAIAPTVIPFPEVVEGELERYEGMLVTINAPLTASQNYFQGRYGQITLSAAGRLEKPTNRYPAGSAEATALASHNALRRIILDDGSSLQNPSPIPYIGADNTLRAGDTVPSITGVIDYGLATNASAGPSDYKIHPSVTPLFSRDNPRTLAPASVGGNVKVASFNVLNYFTTIDQDGAACYPSMSPSDCRGADSAAEFTRQRDKIINAIQAINADVMGLTEIENNGNGAVRNLVDGLNAALGAGTYASAAMPVGGTGTDAIRVAMIYKPDKLSPVGDAVSDTDPIHNRPPLAQTFTAANGEKFTVLVNHFKSKGSCPSDSSDPNADQSDGQGCWNALRVSQAQQLVNFIAAREASVGDDDAIVIGDLNAYGKEDPVLELADSGLVDQIARFNSSGYSYIFDGEAGYLDHVLVTAALSSQISGAVHWPINADEPSVIDYNTEFKSQDLYSNSVYRSSDHDPVIVGLKLVKKLSGSDTVSDFQAGTDLIVLTQLLQGLGITLANPLADGYANCTASRTGSAISIDPDGAAGSARPCSLLVVKGVGCVAGNK